MIRPARPDDAARVARIAEAGRRENRAMYPHLGYTEVVRRRLNGFDRVFFEKRVQARSISTDPTE
ncbi:hypothetical protein GGQ68_002609 [Sagittula marina]|uniref:Uncharacterized protein n=1 Tax=Sagittula marina TaxID=943940 RepID=A0A7W6GSR0_9RHOB|nr:hypothetical protein [Sagittula marina]MBB3986270.1 hypothetical protein [Sagittula marina]